MSTSVSPQLSSMELKRRLKPQVSVKPVSDIGPNVFIKFHKQVGVLNEELRHLCHAARKLGGCAGILSASTRLRDRLGRVLSLFTRNALELYPQDLKVYIECHPTLTAAPRQYKHRDFQEHVTVANNSPVEEDLVMEFSHFAEDVEALFTCFPPSSQSVDESPDKSLAEELRLWAHSLRQFQHDYKTVAVQQYLYDSMADIGVRLEDIARRYIAIFTKFGIAAARASQERTTSNLTYQTIISSLFASITASMLQVWTTGDSPSNRLASVLWYTSLIFSISSAVNSLIALSWVQAVYRSPDHCVPWWVKMWIRRFPLVSLVASVACFFLGLIIFVSTSPQGSALTIITTLFSSLSCLGLFLTSGWFSLELAVYTFYEGRLWLMDVIKDVTETMRASITLWWSSLLAHGHSPAYPDSDVEIGQLRPMGIGWSRRTRPGRQEPISFWIGLDKDALTASSRAKHRWHEAFRRIISPRRILSLPSKFTHLVQMAAQFHDSITKLQQLTVTICHQSNEKHEALVRSLQFSPDGKLLVTSSWDSKSLLLRIGSPTLCESRLEHSAGFGYCHQMEWSPDGRYILGRSSRQLAIWDMTRDGREGRQAEVLVHRPDIRDVTLRRAAWNGNSKEFFVVQGNKVLTKDLHNTVTRDYTPRHLHLRDICVTSDSNLMICVGEFLRDDHRRPQKFGIIVWDLYKRTVVGEMPVYHNTNAVTVAHDDSTILVSYEDKAPSESWRLKANASQHGQVSLEQRHTYIPHDNVSFTALPSIFGGEDDHLVLRAANDGHIHVWDRDSAALIYCILRPSHHEERLTAFAWNKGSKEYMFATGAHDGTVRIWTTPIDEASESGTAESDSDTLNNAYTTSAPSTPLIGG